MSGKKILQLPALEIRQGKEKFLYSFAVDGKLLHQFASVSRISRDDENTIQGYQRPEVMTHIEEIREYIESPDPMFPNALVLAFDKRVRFEPSDVPTNNDYTRWGMLLIPLEEKKQVPGWIVDGQQRAAAIRSANVEQFPICVTAFISDSLEEQRSQFILVNSTKPLPKGLIYELLPATNGILPELLQRKQFPSRLMERLNFEEDSPFFGKIKTPTNPGGIIKDNSVLRMLENSMSDGALSYYMSNQTGQAKDEESERVMWLILKNYWETVAKLFEEAWEQKNTKDSRLLHGVGIVSMGYLMDDIYSRHFQEGIPTKEVFEKDLLPLIDECRWSRGTWDFGPGKQRKWNELQNTTSDITILTNYLLHKYRTLVWDKDRNPSSRETYVQRPLF